MKTLVIIPSRLSATRLPGKPLLEINGLSMISHVFKRAERANIGEVIVASGDQEIIDDVKKNGGNAVITKNHHKTGTDRIFEVLQKIDSSNIDLIMNLQGDEPLIDVGDIKKLKYRMIEYNSEIGTLASKISDKELYKNQNAVKVTTEKNLKNLNFPKANNFTRKILNETSNIYHHIGIYCFKKEILEAFVSFKQSINEIKNRLEQCRALDNGININVALAKSSVKGIDTKADFIAMKKIMEYKS